MELFENTKNFPTENLEYLRYRSLFSRAGFRIGRLDRNKSQSDHSVASKPDSNISTLQFPQLSVRRDHQDSAFNDKEKQSLNKKGTSNLKLLNTTKNNSMSGSPNIYHRGDNHHTSPPPYRVNQTVMNRTVPPSRHHKNCIPKKKEQIMTRNDFEERNFNSPPSQTAGNRSIGFDFCQEGHSIFPMATRRHFRFRGRLTCDFCESMDGIDWYCKNCNKNFCRLCKNTHEMSRGSFTSYRDLMDRVFYQKATLRHLAWRINDIKYQYENEMREKMVFSKKK